MRWVIASAIACVVVAGCYASLDGFSGGTPPGADDAGDSAADAPLVANDGGSNADANATTTGDANGAPFCKSRPTATLCFDVDGPGFESEGWEEQTTSGGVLAVVQGDVSSAPNALRVTAPADSVDADVHISHTIPITTAGSELVFGYRTRFESAPVATYASLMTIFTTSTTFAGIILSKNTLRGPWLRVQGGTPSTTNEYPLPALPDGWFRLEMVMTLAADSDETTVDVRVDGVSVVPGGPKAGPPTPQAIVNVRVGFYFDKPTTAVSWLFDDVLVELK